MSAYAGLQPDDYCQQCGAPMYRIFAKLCHTCKCRTQPSALAYYSTTTSGYTVHHTSDSTVPYTPIPAAEPEPEPASIKLSDVEELTPEHTRRIYQLVYQACKRHKHECQTCKRHKAEDIPYLCLEHMMLLQGLKFWERHL